MVLLTLEICLIVTLITNGILGLPLPPSKDSDIVEIPDNDLLTGDEEFLAVTHGMTEFLRLGTTTLSPPVQPDRIRPSSPTTTIKPVMEVVTSRLFPASTTTTTVRSTRTTTTARPTTTMVTTTRSSSTVRAATTTIPTTPLPVDELVSETVTEPLKPVQQAQQKVDQIKPATIRVSPNQSLPAEIQQNPTLSPKVSTTVQQNPTLSPKLQTTVQQQTLVSNPAVFQQQTSPIRQMTPTIQPTRVVNQFVSPALQQQPLTNMLPNPQRIQPQQKDVIQQQPSRLPQMVQQQSIQQDFNQQQRVPQMNQQQPIQQSIMQQQQPIQQSIVQQPIQQSMMQQQQPIQQSIMQQQPNRLNQQMIQQDFIQPNRGGNQFLSQNAPLMQQPQQTFIQQSSVPVRQASTATSNKKQSSSPALNNRIAVNNRQGAGQQQRGGQTLNLIPNSIWPQLLQVPTISSNGLVQRFPSST